MRKLIWTIIIFSLFGVILFFKSGKGHFNYIVQKDIVFKTVDGIDLKADIYLPDYSGKKPGVLVVHGGGWDKISGDMTTICKDLARAGFVAFNINYRLAPVSLYPKSSEDVLDGAKWFKKNAEKFFVDPSRIGAWGYSAGSQLVLLLGLNPENGIRAIVSGGTPAYFPYWPHSPIITKFIGASYQEKPEIWLAASPLTHVQANSPPVFLYNGQWDRLVDVDQMYMLKDALIKKHREIETYVAPFMGHITTYLFSQESIDLGIEFLSRHLHPITL